jgi:hypothetical protein
MAGVAVDGRPQHEAAHVDLLVGHDLLRHDEVQRQLDHRGHFRVVRPKAGACRRGAHEGAQLEVADRDPHRVELAQDANRGRLDPELLPRLA